MTHMIDAKEARAALVALPEGTSYDETPTPEQVYLPPSHLKAMDPNNMLVTGMRGAGKTFWWAALQESAVRQFINRTDPRSALNESTDVRTGFGIRPALEKYPDRDVLQNLMRKRVEPRIIWRTVLAWQLAEQSHPLQQKKTWRARVDYVADNPEAIARLFEKRDAEFDCQGEYLLMLFDALDRCADNWKDMYRLIRGLMQTALDMRSYRRLRVKMFLRSDQVDETQIADFQDASKVLSSSVELSWPARELYGLLWHLLINGQTSDPFKRFLGDEWQQVNDDGQRKMFVVRRTLVMEGQREKFHGITGPWMGRGPKRGFPYTWIPNHLSDTGGRVSPRSFLAALREAAADTDDQYPDYQHPLHYDSIKRGVQKASSIRVNELREDYPWVNDVMIPLNGLVVPCKFDEIADRWQRDDVVASLRESISQNEIKLPPRHIELDIDGVRQDLESLGIFLRMHDERVNIPDVFRVGYGIGRRGGVRPVRGIRE